MRSSVSLARKVCFRGGRSELLEGFHLRGKARRAEPVREFYVHVSKGSLAGDRAES